VDAILALWHRYRPHPSIVGIGLKVLSLFAMVWLARAKRRAAAALGGRALQADAFQTTACFWYSLITLAGIGLNTLLAWWWADPVAALVVHRAGGSGGLARSGGRTSPWLRPKSRSQVPWASPPGWCAQRLWYHRRGEWVPVHLVRPGRANTCEILDYVGD